MNIFGRFRSGESRQDAPATPSRRPRARRRRIFYGWWIVLAGGLGMAFSAGVNFHGFGNFIIPLQNQFGWNRTQISVAFSLARLESGLFGPVEGWLVDRLGPRRLIFIGVPIMALGYVVFSRVDNFLHFVLVYVLLISLGNSIGMGMPMTTAVANWFNRKRGLAFGIMWSGVGLGGLFVPVLGWLVERYSWSTAALIVGIFVFVMGTPIGLVMRHRPEPYGYMPDGDRPRRQAGGAGQARVMSPDLSADFSAREAMSTSSFWYLTLSVAARSLVSGGVGLHLVPYFEGLGASPVFAAFLAGSAGWMSIPGRLGLGALGDYVNKRYVMAVSLVLMTVAIVMMARATDIESALPALLVYAAAQGGISVLPQALFAEYFGRRSYGTIQGFRSSIQMIGIIIGPVISGFVFDQTGSYEMAFLGFSAATILSMALVLLARQPTRPAAAAKAAPSG